MKEAIASWIAKSVAATYVSIIRHRTGKMISVKIPEGSKTEANAVKVWRLTRGSGKYLWSIMETAIREWSPDVCLRIFARDYPPFNVVVGDKSRRVLARYFPQPSRLTEEQFTKKAEFIAFSLLNDVGRKAALEALKGGWPPERKMREKIERIILDRNTDR